MLSTPPPPSSDNHYIGGLGAPQPARALRKRNERVLSCSVSGCGLDDGEFGVDYSHMFLFSALSRPACWALPALYRIDTVNSFPRGKVAIVWNWPLTTILSLCAKLFPINYAFKLPTVLKETLPFLVLLMQSAKQCKIAVISCTLSFKTEMRDNSFTKYDLFGLRPVGSRLFLLDVRVRGVAFQVFIYLLWSEDSGYCKGERILTGYWICSAGYSRNRNLASWVNNALSLKV